MTKKITILMAILFVGLTSNSQNPFKFLKVNHVGAMGTEDWTTGWTNWNPNQSNYPAPTELVTLNAATKTSGVIEITNTVTLDASKTYLLTGIVYVRSGAVLNIPAGTLIRCQGDPNATPANWATLVVQRGGKVNVLGTKTAPVVFTSNKALGNRMSGDWGGIIVLGKALNNFPGGQANCTSCAKGEGIIEGPFGSPDGIHGGNDDSDNSGIIQYCRIEYPGIIFGPNNEINGLTLGSVGYGTTLDHIQISYCNDDSYEWFGGSVNSRYIVSYKTTDDDFDTDFGYRGFNQFGISMRDSTKFDPTWGATSGGSTSEGFESDNDGTGSLAKPQTEAVFSHYTMVGPIAVGETYAQHSSVFKSAFRRGARIRRNSGQSILNTIFMGYRNAIMIDGSASERKASFGNTLNNNDTLQVRNCIFLGNGGSLTATANGLVEVASGRDTAKANAFFKSTVALNRINPVAWASGTLLIDPNNYTAPNFMPVVNSPALTGASFDNTKYTNVLAKTTSYNAKNNSRIYPNPINKNSELNIELKDPSNSLLRIINTEGVIVYEQQLTNSTSTKVNLKSFNSGMYFITVLNNTQIETHKLLIK